MIKEIEEIKNFTNLLEDFLRDSNHKDAVAYNQLIQESQLLFGSSYLIHKLVGIPDDTDISSKRGYDNSSLIKHINKHHLVSIKKSDESELLNMGYYHGYKRYRFVKKYNSDGRLNIKHFEEIRAIYQFDMNLKGLFYPLLMLIETGLKNRVLSSLVSNDSSGIYDVLHNKLNRYADYPVNSKKYNEAYEHFEALRVNILGTISYYSDKNVSIKHYKSSEYQIPLWAYFEVITMGQFSKILGALNKEGRNKLTNDFQFVPDKINSVELLVNGLLDLRNATMHNSVIFDANFSSGVSKIIKNHIKLELHLNSFTCLFIEDYFVLLIWAAFKLNFSVELLNNYIDSFEDIVTKFDTDLNNRDILFKIISTNRKDTIQKLRNFLDLSE